MHSFASYFLTAGINRGSSSPASLSRIIQLQKIEKGIQMVSNDSLKPLTTAISGCLALS